MQPEHLALIGDFVMWYLVFLASTVVHESAHAFVAWRGGDSTAAEAGTMTLDPWPHIKRSPFGMVLVPLLTFFQAGWMMGWASVPYDPHWGARHPRRAAAMSAAGPAANLVLALIAFIAIKITLSTGLLMPPESITFSRLVAAPRGAETGGLGALALFLSVLLNLNVLLALFNLMPVRPLDGSGILEGLWPDNPLSRLFRTNPNAMWIGLLAVFFGFGYIFRPVFSLIIALVHPGLSYG